GRELSVGVFDGEALCVTEILSERGFYDYDAKYEDGGSVHVLPAELPDEITAEALSMASWAHKVLGCRGVTRSDFRFDDTQERVGDLYLLEINTQPGMTATSLVPEQAAYRGMDFPELVSCMVEEARCDL
ncbi:MAG: D-alanine--D-alanine ligase, partial [Alphaproteobacteria bacterium]|nr:D-alanine--D-alanine ligase [Alphaproteobacteria bacterium]